MNQEQAARDLIRILQLAYSGELAASIAYSGHARALRDEAERREVLDIRQEELDHRRRVGEMLALLGSAPDARREVRARRIGTAIAKLCRVGGWFIPMYGAGRLERRNIGEYEHAARCARRCGHAELAGELLGMAEVEWDHERTFREKAQSHPLARIFPMWSPPPPRSSIRHAFGTWVAESVAGA